MEENLYEMFARRAWEAMNPDGVPWHYLPSEGMKERMRDAAKAVLKMMGIEEPEGVGLSTFQAEWVRRRTIVNCGHDFVATCPLCQTEHLFAQTSRVAEPKVIHDAFVKWCEEHHIEPSSEGFYYGLWLGAWTEAELNARRKR